MKKLLGVAVVAFFVAPATAMAASQYTVTTTADNTTTDTFCSLREATENSSGGAHTDCPVTGTPSENKIIFSPSLGTNPTINLMSGSPGQLDVNTNDLTIQGPATVNGATNSGFRVLESSGIILTLNSLTISNGSESTDGVGGGISQNAGRLFLNNSTVSGNKTTQSSAVSSVGVQGGGIYSTGKVTLTNSSVVNNMASATYTGATTGGALSLGGGVEVNGDDVDMENSVASGNQALASGSGSGTVEADGGGVRNDGEVLIQHSTISGNLASATATASGPPVVQGGGLLFHGSASIDIELSTIANNRMKAPASTTLGNQVGGGINDSSGTTNTANYVSDTIAGNGLDPASQTSGTISGLNFLNGGSGVTDNFSNTIIANPVGSGATNCEGSTPYATGGTPNVDFPFPMADPGQACFTSGGAIMNADPLLGPLGNNGGATQTMLPTPTSPVIDKGTASDQNDLTQDQRGLTRPVVFPGLTHPLDGSDIGAVELQQACAGQSTPTSTCATGGGGGGGGGAPPPASSQTGQRAAALAKCKKKHKKKARKKCKKRANLLPV
jgi:CSLREA domain-containing protein